MDVNSYIVVASASVTGLGIVAVAALSGWRGWLQLQRQQFDRSNTAPAGPGGAGSRIEIADLKERIRKLEAIAAGVEL